MPLKCRTVLDTGIPVVDTPYGLWQLRINTDGKKFTYTYSSRINARVMDYAKATHQPRLDQLACSSLPLVKRQLGVKLAYRVEIAPATAGQHRVCRCPSGLSRLPAISVTS